MIPFTSSLCFRRGGTNRDAARGTSATSSRAWKLVATETVPTSSRSQSSFAQPAESSSASAQNSQVSQKKVTKRQRSNEYFLVKSKEVEA